DRLLGDPPFNLSATASSGLPVSFSLLSGPASLNGSTLTMTNGGVVTVRAAQAGNTNYNAAPNVDRSFTVSTNTPPTVTLTAPTNGQFYFAPATVSFTAAASDTDGTVVRTEFYLGNTLIASVTNQPPTAAVTNGVVATNVIAGAYVASAVAVDNGGARTTNSVNITVHPPPTIQVSVQGVGTVTNNPAKATYTYGESVTLTATPGRYYAFSRWSDNVTPSNRVITVDVTNVFTAIFTNTVPLETLNYGGIIREAPVGMPAIFVDGVFVPSGTVTKGNSAQITMQSSFGSVIIFYTLDGSEPALFSTQYSGPFTVTTSVVVRAMAMNNVDFSTSPVTDPVQVEIVPAYTVATSTPGGGSVSVNPATGPYLSNSVVTVTATPSSGWSFLDWTGDVTGTNPTAQVVMNGNKSIQAIFGTAINRSVTGNGSVLIDPPAGPYPFGSRVTLSAVPNAGAYFTLWGGAAAGNSVSPLRYAVTSANPTISALFSALGANQYSLTPLVNGAGMITLNPAKNVFASGEAVTVTATPSVGWTFMGWSGDAGGLANPLAFSIDQNKTITGNFALVPGTVVGINEDPVYNQGDQYGQSTVPQGLSNVVAIAAGGYHNLALRNDGTLIAWGRNDFGQANIPAGLSNVAAIAAGQFYNLVLKTDGTVVDWGGVYVNGGVGVPSGLSNVVAIAAGDGHSLALREDGTVVAWGNNGYGEVNVPAGLSNVVAVAAGYYHSLALRGDGTVAAWGMGQYGATNVPAGLSRVVAISAGHSYSLALKDDGTVVGWGQGLSIPSGLTSVVAISGGFGGLALKQDGTAVSLGGIVVPAGLSNVVAVSAFGRFHALALVDDTRVPGAPYIIGQPASQTAPPGSTSVLRVFATGSAPLTYQWRKAGVDIPRATNQWLQLTNVQSADVGNYTVVVSNSYGSVESQPATLTLAKVTQTIVFSAPAEKTFGDPPFELAATASSGLPVTFSIVSGPATIFGNTITITGAGTVVVRASQPGNENYNPAPDVDRTFTVAKATATVTLGGLNATYDGSPKPVTVSTVPAGLATTVTYDGNTTAPVNAGNYAVLAVVNEANYQGSADGTLVIAKAPQTISFGALPNKVLGTPPFSVNATASSGLPVSFSIVAGPATISGSTVTVTGGGTVTVRASQAGNANYEAAPNVDQSFEVRLLLTAQATTGGTVSRNPVLADYGYGTTVQLTAVADTGYAFTGWTGDASGTNNPLVVTMTTNKSITATFVFNNPPTISAIPNQTNNEDTVIGPIAFTVGDAEQAAGSLSLSASSSNTGLIPNGSVTFGGSGANRTLSIMPATNQFGTATITVTVSDGSATTSTNFQVTVNYLPDDAGEKIWEHVAGLPISSTPAIASDGTLYFAAGYDTPVSKLTALNPDGSKKWEIQSSDGPTGQSPVVASDGTIYLPLATNLYAFNASGSNLWAFTAGGSTTVALGADGRIYFGSGDHKLYALNPNGVKAWEFLSTHMVSAPSVGPDGTIYFASNSGGQKLYAIRPNGTEKWNFDVGSDVVVAPAIGSDGTIYVGTIGGTFYAVNPNGTLKWQYGSGRVQSSAAIATDGTIYFGATYGSQLLALNPNGTFKWAFNANGYVYSSPAIDTEGVIYFGAAYPGPAGNKFYAVNPDGTKKWEFNAGDANDSGVAIGSDGAVYFGSHDGKLYALKGNGALANSPWPKFAHDARNTGRALQTNVLWIELAQETKPSVRSDFGFVWDTVRNEGVLFGGGRHDPPWNQFNDTWVFKNGAWTQKFPANSPSPRRTHAMAFDSNRGRTVLFGGELSGYGGSGSHETWEWDGTNWFQRTSAASPPQTDNAVMVYDEARKVCVLFGGFTAPGQAYDNHTWTWDGTNWLQKAPAMSPAARIYHAMAFDRLRQRVVMAGGGTTGNLNDTWEWDGANWEQKVASNYPTNHLRAAMAYSEGLGSCVLFGAFLPSLYNDAWLWDGANWRLLNPPFSPAGRWAHNLIEDRLNNRLIAFGGSYSDTGFYNDTWALVPGFAPTVTLTNPLPGATFTAPASITLQASASDSDGTVVNVDFYYALSSQPSTLNLIGEDTTSPFAIAWSNVIAGTYLLTAKATDNDGATTTSSAVNISVHTPPTIVITVQGKGTVTKDPEKAQYQFGEPVVLTATPARWYAFSQWSDGSNLNPRPIIIAATNQYTAVFTNTVPLETLNYGGIIREAPVGMPAIFVDG
ncbi:MAG: PQQ-binding-like beta-propeller repeat protein, partial [Verrucomicrobiota bacterium]